MIDPWRYVDADDELVADLLAGTIEAVLDLGGWLHPQARVVARAGHLHVECDADDGAPLVRLPAEAFVPIARVTWSDSTEELQYLEVSTDLSAAQHELLILQTALLNACGRVPWLMRNHPAVADDLEPGLLELLRVLRPDFRRPQPTPASVLWSTRVFRLPATGTQEPEPMALPIVDLLDHRAGAATGTWTGDAFLVPVAHADAGPATWLDYGMDRDAIEMALDYGFADLTSPVAHSAPMGVEVPGAGPVRVLAATRGPSGEVPAPTVSTVEGELLLSHLTFDARDPDRAADAVRQATGWTGPQVGYFIDVVVEANIRRDDDLCSAAAASANEATRVIGAASARHRDIVTSSRC